MKEAQQRLIGAVQICEDPFRGTCGAGQQPDLDDLLPVIASQQAYSASSSEAGVQCTMKPVAGVPTASNTPLLR